MYAISNKQREEITKLLAAIRSLPGNDTKTTNSKGVGREPEDSE
jgi:hypothetical protein